MADKRKKGSDCYCERPMKHKDGERRVGGKHKCKRKRQTLVYNADDEIVWHEPYMQCLRKEFSDISIPCDSKIELPWKDIALPTTGIKIRPNILMDDSGEGTEFDKEKEAAESKTETKESSGTMHLPWNDLLVTDTVQVNVAMADDGVPCDSTLEIPWSDLALERPIIIQPIEEEESCAPDDIEVPWDDILVPKNIVIEIKKKKKHPSSKAMPKELLASDSSNTSCRTPPCCRQAGKK